MNQQTKLLLKYLYFRTCLDWTNLSNHLLLTVVMKLRSDLITSDMSKYQTVLWVIIWKFTHRSGLWDHKQKRKKDFQMNYKTLVSLIEIIAKFNLKHNWFFFNLNNILLVAILNWTIYQAFILHWNEWVINHMKLQQCMILISLTSISSVEVII